MSTLITQEAALAPVTPMQLIERAAAQNASIEQMAQLFELKLRVEADEARKAFSAAMAKFKENAPTILKNRFVEHNKFWHATLDQVVSKLAPALSEVEIRHRWDVDQSKASVITVTCILTHSLGHSESTTLSAPADASGSKNAVQAIGSTVTYLMRYTLLAATGMAAIGTDDDAKAAGPEPLGGQPRMTGDEIDRHVGLIESSRDLDSLKGVYRVAYEDAKTINDVPAMKVIIAAYGKRKAELA